MVDNKLYYKNAFQWKAHLPLADRKSNSYNFNDLDQMLQIFLPSERLTSHQLCNHDRLFSALPLIFRKLPSVLCNLPSDINGLKKEMCGGPIHIDVFLTCSV